MIARLKLEHFTATKATFDGDQLPDDAFALLGDALAEWLRAKLKSAGVADTPIIKGHVEPGATIKGPVFIHAQASVEAGAYIQGPVFVGPGSEVRHAAYLRGNVYVGAKCVVGHATEAKGAFFMDGAKAGHFAYVGDSILCRDVNLGAGTKLANLRLKGDEVKFLCPETNRWVASGLRKFGAVFGDLSQSGCNAVTSPGSLLLPETAILPCVHFHGTIKSGIAK